MHPRPECNILITKRKPNNRLRSVSKKKKMKKKKYIKQLERVEKGYLTLCSNKIILCLNIEKNLIWINMCLVIRIIECLLQK